MGTYLQNSSGHQHHIHSSVHHSGSVRMRLCHSCSPPPLSQLLPTSGQPVHIVLDHGGDQGTIGQRSGLLVRRRRPHRLVGRLAKTGVVAMATAGGSRRKLESRLVQLLPEKKTGRVITAVGRTLNLYLYTKTYNTLPVIAFPNKCKWLSP